MEISKCHTDWKGEETHSCYSHENCCTDSLQNTYILLCGQILPPEVRRTYWSPFDVLHSQTVVGSDVEALYPSVEDTKVAEIIFQAIMETKVEFEGVNYQEGARYIVLNCTEQECRLGPLGRILPVRRYVKGSRPGVTGAGPMGAEVWDQE